MEQLFIALDRRKRNFYDRPEDGFRSLPEEVSKKK